MNFISDNQLQKYESIIKSIEQNFEENRRLKSVLENENNKIFLKKLRNNNTVFKLSQVNVKVFPNLIDLYTLYDKNIPPYENFKSYMNCKFYLIEIYLTELLIQKLRNLKWYLLVTVYHENGCCSKVINANNKTCIMDVIPVEETIINCNIETDLFLQLEDQMSAIKLDKTQTDISYHLSSSTYTRRELNRTHILTNITQLHNPTIEIEKLLLPILCYEIRLHVDVTEFLKILVQNCYHLMNLEIYNELESGNKSKMEFTLCYGQQQKYSITCNDQSLTISANYHDLYLLKQYFYKVLHNHKQEGNYAELNDLKVRLCIIGTMPKPLMCTFVNFCSSADILIFNFVNARVTN